MHTYKSTNEYTSKSTLNCAYKYTYEDTHTNIFISMHIYKCTYKYAYKHT